MSPNLSDSGSLMFRTAVDAPTRRAHCLLACLSFVSSGGLFDSILRKASQSDVPMEIFLMGSRIT
eukprot:762985-Amphidinium_carterae.1